ncbi:hypothetical protein FRC18_007869, partial [Serendipita sp. 400]
PRWVDAVGPPPSLCPIHTHKKRESIFDRNTIDFSRRLTEFDDNVCAKYCLVLYQNPSRIHDRALLPLFARFTTAVRQIQRSNVSKWPKKTHLEW